MQTHDDRDFRSEWLNSLAEKAQQMTDARESEITAGKDSEKPLAEWKHKGVGVMHLPPDEHGILRISIGGGEDTPVDVKYCVFRGNRGHCVDLLRKALKALETGPGH